MMWLAGLLAPLFFIGIVALALSGAEPPPRIQTFSHSSPDEQEFDRRGFKLQMIGLSTLGVAIVVSVLAGLHWLG